MYFTAGLPFNSRSYRVKQGPVWTRLSLMMVLYLLHVPPARGGRLRPAVCVHWLYQSHACYEGAVVLIGP